MPYLRYHRRYDREPLCPIVWNLAARASNVAAIAKVDVIFIKPLGTELPDLGEERVHINECPTVTHKELGQPANATDIQQQISRF